jgi:hypothetical protein
MIPKAVLSWLPGILIGIGNGMLREAGFRAFLDELPAHQLSALSFTLIFGVYTWFAIGRLRPGSPRDALGIGALWLALTIAFEFLFGHYVMGHTWERLLHDWVVVLLWIATAPFVMCLARRVHRVRAIPAPSSGTPPG